MKESPAGLLLAQNRKQIFFHARSLWEHDIAIFITSSSVYYNKQKIYELHSLEIWASISPQSNGGVKKQVYEYFLQEWAVKLTVKWVFERRSIQWILWEKAGTGSAAKNHLQS